MFSMFLLLSYLLSYAVWFLSCVVGSSSVDLIFVTFNCDRVSSVNMEVSDLPSLSYQCTDTFQHPRHSHFWESALVHDKSEYVQVVSLAKATAEHIHWCHCFGRRVCLCWFVGVHPTVSSVTDFHCVPLWLAFSSRVWTSLCWLLTPVYNGRHQAKPIPTLKKTAVLCRNISPS